MYSVHYTNRFKKDLLRCQRRGLNIRLIMNAVSILERSGSLPERYYPHKLKGKRRGQWECHIEPDGLMVWEQNDERLTLLFLETGTHADLF